MFAEIPNLRGFLFEAGSAVATFLKSPTYVWLKNLYPSTVFEPYFLLSVFGSLFGYKDYF